MNELYYLNLGNNNCCNKNNSNYLNKMNLLSEFSNDEDKEKVRYNLGIQQILDEFRTLLNSEIFERGGVLWDDSPTLGNFNHVLSSDSLYNTLLNYCLKSELEDSTQLMWNRVVLKVNELYDKIECELGELNTSLRNLIEELRCEFNNLQISTYRTIDDIKNNINNIYNMVITLVRTGEGGTAISTMFGDKDELGVSLKTLTLAINKIWDKISEMSGEVIQGINMIVYPKYFIGNECNVNISASSSENIGKFEKLAFFKRKIGDIEWIPVGELMTDVDTFATSTDIDSTTEIKCEATILGIPYELVKIIHNYKEYWIFTGNYSTDLEIIEQINDISNNVPVTVHLRASREITCNDGDYIYIVLGESLDLKFIRVDLNGLEVLLIKRIINIDNVNSYVVYTSVDAYNLGTYNINING